jgi:hypothetical protein
MSDGKKCLDMLLTLGGAHIAFVGDVCERVAHMASYAMSAPPKQLIAFAIAKDLIRSFTRALPLICRVGYVGLNAPGLSCRERCSMRSWSCRIVAFLTSKVEQIIYNPLGFYIIPPGVV